MRNPHTKQNRRRMGRRQPEYVVVEADNPAGFSLSCRLVMGFFGRLRGLLGTKPGAHFERGILLANCASVHTNGMAYPIDIAFLDASPCLPRRSESIFANGEACQAARVMAVHRNVEPGKVVSCSGAQATIEREARMCAQWLHAGSLVVFRWPDEEDRDAKSAPLAPNNQSSTQIPEHIAVQVG